MSAARKALDALVAAGNGGTPRPWGAQDVPAVGIVAVAQVVFAPNRIVTGNVVASLDPEDHGDDDREGHAICMANANAIALAVNLAAPLAAVVRAAMDRPWWRGGFEDADGMDIALCDGCDAPSDAPGEAGRHKPGCKLSAIDAALDALESAAAGMGFQP